jgi:hypothetical protein
LKDCFILLLAVLGFEFRASLPLEQLYQLRLAFNLHPPVARKGRPEKKQTGWCSKRQGEEKAKQRENLKN